MAVTDFPLIGGIGKVVLGGPERTGVASDLLTSFWVQALHEMMKSSRTASAGNHSKRRRETNMYAFFQKYAAYSTQLDPSLVRGGFFARLPGAYPLIVFRGIIVCRGCVGLLARDSLPRDTIFPINPLA
jgi:hypothetical protein